MQEITSELIKGSIIRRLSSSFPGIKVYREKVLKDMVKPCFFVRQLNFVSTSKMQGRSTKDFLYHVRYHSSSDERAELDNMACTLSGILDEITLLDGLPVYSGETKAEIVDGVLQFTVSYSVGAIKHHEKAPAMGQLEIKE